MCFIFHKWEYRGHTIRTVMDSNHNIFEVEKDKEYPEHTRICKRCGKRQILEYDSQGGCWRTVLSEVPKGHKMIV